MLTVWSQRIRVLWLVIFVVVQFFRLQARRQRQNATLLWYALYRSDGGNGRQRVVQRAVNFLSALANITWWGCSAKGRRWADPRGEQWKIVQQRWPEDKFRRYYRVGRTRFQLLCADLAASSTCS